MLPNLVSDLSTGSNMKVLNSLLKSMYIVEINNHLKLDLMNPFMTIFTLLYIS